MKYSDKEIVINKMIEKYMKKNDLTMKELGKQLGKGESTVSMWISGKSQPKMGTIQKLSDIFNITTDELIYGDFESLTSEDANIEYLKTLGDDKLIELYKKVKEDGSLLLLTDGKTKLTPEEVAQILNVINEL